MEAKNIDFPFPKLFGRLADELIKKYSLDEERFLSNLAKILNENYKNAKNNPLAQTRKWFMSEKQANARGTDANPLVGGKLASADCSQITDGAAISALALQSREKSMKLSSGGQRSQNVAGSLAPGYR